MPHGGGGGAVRCGRGDRRKVGGLVHGELYALSDEALVLDVEYAVARVVLEADAERLHERHGLHTHRILERLLVAL